MRLLLVLLLLPVCVYGGDAADLMKSIREAGLDAGECYRVREISIARDEAQIFFTDGYLIFGKLVGENRMTAVFTADVEGGDAELLLLPPNRGERKALAKHTESPNLNEHFTSAVFLFADNTYGEIMEQIRANTYIKKSPEMGALLAEKWSPVVRNLHESFGLRLAMDLLLPKAERKGFFGGAMSGKQLGAFDLVFDSRAREQIFAGKSGTEGFEVWTSFTSRSFRNHEFKPEFRVRDYRIETTIDADLKMHCVTRMNIEVTSGTERALPFEISRQMRVTSAMVNGEQAELLMNDAPRTSIESGTGNDLIVVAAARPLEAGKTYEVEIRHEGSVVTDAGNHVYSVGSRGTWYPQRGMQFSKFDLTFRCSKDLDIVASGELVTERVEGDQRVTRRVTDAPIRLAGFNLGVYEKTRFKMGELKIEVCANRGVEHALQPRILEPQWIPLPRRPTRATTTSMPAAQPPPPNPTAHLQSLAADIGEVMEFYAARFGPVPIRTLEVAPVPGRFGQGFPGLIYLSTLSYMQPASLSAQQQMFFGDLLLSHEAAHQWWGNIVTSAGYHDDWVMEALANYSALMFLEKRKGARVMDAALENYRQELLAKGVDGKTAESAGPLVQGMRVGGSWSAILYGKGTWIVHMLRRKMGDDAFLKMLAGLRKNFEDKTISTDEFRVFCAGFLPAKSVDAKLESFFDQWVYGTGIPELKLEYKVTGKAPAWKVTGTVKQAGVDDDFTADVPVEIQAGRSKAGAVNVRASNEPVSFVASAKALPTKVVIDTHSILSK